MSKMFWVYDEETNSWLTGQPNRGCGVYEQNNKWTGNVVLDSQMTFLNYHDTKELAMAEAVETYSKFEKNQ